MACSPNSVPLFPVPEPARCIGPLQEPPSADGGQAVPIEKVIDDVAVMGFSREEVRRVLKQLMESGQSVDLNVVLDRLGAR